MRSMSPPCPYAPYADAALAAGRAGSRNENLPSILPARPAARPIVPAAADVITAVRCGSLIWKRTVAVSPSIQRRSGRSRSRSVCTGKGIERSQAPAGQIREVASDPDGTRRQALRADLLAGYGVGYYSPRRTPAIARSGLFPPRRKKPEFRQHFLNNNPLPHGHGSLRPSFS
jgi:hypothetical protein